MSHNPADDAGAGVAVTREIVNALAYDDHERVLRIINRTEPAVMAWVVASLAQMYRATLVTLLPDLGQARAAMLSAAKALEDDIALTQVEVIVNKHQKGGA